MNAKILVTGTEQHQGLAVMRGLGFAGLHVIAGSFVNNNIGFASRFAHGTAVYTSPQDDPARFAEDVLNIVKRHGVSMIIPVVESTLVALDAYRADIERICRLAAPPSDVLAFAIDKSKTIALAGRVGVPAPRTIAADDIDSALAAARDFEFPVALKPRGNGIHAHTRHRHGFKVKYARSWDELAKFAEEFSRTGTFPLIQEYTKGSGVCVGVLFDGERAVAMMPYARVREVPLTGGVSVVRKTIPLDQRLYDYTVALLGALRWRGMAMVEYKYDAEADRYVLMEINGRFQASTALSLDAGINFPELAYRLHADLPLPAAPLTYQLGIRERWLRGDIVALMSHIMGITAAAAVAEARAQLPTRSRALWNFLADFRPGTAFDEFKWYDPMPGLLEAVECSRVALKYAYSALRPVRPLPVKPSVPGPTPVAGVDIKTREKNR